MRLRRRAAPVPPQFQKKHPTDAAPPDDTSKKHPTDSVPPAVPPKSDDAPAVPPSLPGGDAPTPFDPKAMPSPGQPDSAEEPVTCCPFCGSRLLVGRSDGSTECGYCNHTFKVMTVPEFAAMPYVVDGKPYEPESPYADPNVDDANDDDAPAVPDDDSDDPDDEDTAVVGYRTLEGALLNREDYITHLALRLADGPEEFARVVAKRHG